MQGQSEAFGVKSKAGRFEFAVSRDNLRFNEVLPSEVSKSSIGLANEVVAFWKSMPHD